MEDIMNKAEFVTVDCKLYFSSTPPKR